MSDQSINYYYYYALIAVGSILPPILLPTTARVLRHLVAVRLTKYDSE